MKISEALTEIVDLEKKLGRAIEKRRQTAIESFKETKYAEEKLLDFRKREAEWLYDRKKRFDKIDAEIQEISDKIIKLKVQIGRSNIKYGIDEDIKQQAFIRKEIQEFNRISDSEDSFLSPIADSKKIDVESRIRDLEAEKNTINKRIHRVNHSEDLVIG